VTVPEATITADPPQLSGPTAAATAALRQQVASLLSGPLRTPAADIVQLLNHPSSPHYVVLAHGVAAGTARKVLALMAAHRLGGIAATPAYARAYPNGDLASNLLGFATSSSTGDLRGRAGLEQSFN